MTEHMDAARAMQAIDLGDRALVRAALAATLVKDADHLPVFYTAFDVFFSLRGWGGAEELLNETEDASAPTGADAPGPRRGTGGGSTTMSAEELAELLFRALRDGDVDALRRGAGEAVTRYAGMEPGRPVGGP